MDRRHYAANSRSYCVAAVQSAKTTFKVCEALKSKAISGDAWNA